MLDELPPIDGISPELFPFISGAPLPDISGIEPLELPFIPLSDEPLLGIPEPPLPGIFIPPALPRPLETLLVTSDVTSIDNVVLPAVMS